MFNKNLEAIRAKNPLLAIKLQSVSMEKAQEHIQVYEAETKDVIITYDETPLDSVYDPIREAKTIWNKTIQKELSKNDMVVVFGLGLGYLFKRAFVNCDSRIVIYEPLLDVMRFVFQHIDFSAELQDKRVYITDNLDDCMAYISQKYLAKDIIEVIYPKTYATVAKQQLIDLSTKVLEVCQMRNLDTNTILKLSKYWSENTIKITRLIQKTRPLSWMKDKFKDKAAMILCAGPSLKDDVETIKANKDKYVIFAVNKALNYLHENGIKPDFAIFADAQHIDASIDKIYYEMANINKIADSRADFMPYTLPGNFVFSYYSQNDPFAQKFKSFYPNDISLYKTAGTAAAMAYYSAKELGCSKFIFSGLDLAFKDDTIYADGTKLELDEKGNITGYKIGSTKSLVQVKNVKGETINTRDDYALFIRQFEDIFAKDSGFKIYNTSKFGALINGMEYISLKEILIKESFAQKPDVDAFVQDLYQDSAPKWKDISSKYVELIKAEQKSMAEINTKAKAILPDLEDIYNTLLQTASLDEIKDKAIQTSEKCVNIMSEIINNVLLGQYFQGEFLQYTRIGQNSSTSGINEFIKNKKFEVDLFKQVLQATDDLNDLAEFNLIHLVKLL